MHRTRRCAARNRNQAGYYRIAPVLLVVLLTAALAGGWLYGHRPNLYDHTRTDLQEASRELDTFQHDFAALQQDRRDGITALKAAIERLRRAAAADPADVAEIDAIADRLRHWEQGLRPAPVASRTADTGLGSLTGRLRRLIDKRVAAAHSRGNA
jgi:hypothetical protein